MVRISHQRILLIGDAQHEMEPALRQALPGASLTAVGDYFDGIAELSAGQYTAVVAATEPIERRPEAAVRALRELAGPGRLILFGYPALEAISRKMLAFGCDEYVVTPANAAELEQMFVAPVLRIAPAKAAEVISDQAAPAVAAAPSAPPALGTHWPLADIVLDALLEHPGNPMPACVEKINTQVGPGMQLFYQPIGKAPTATAAEPIARDGGMLLTCGVCAAERKIGTLSLSVPSDLEEQQVLEAREFLAQFAQLAAKLYTLEDQHKRLQKLAITDELTGVFNRRYFKHFLTTILERARVKRFWVTLLLFDIDNFKKYNDEFGHSHGDEILRETAAVMKRCVREHDLVARIGGDEFAVVFWDKEGPRQPKEPNKIPVSRPPQEPREIFDRFKRLIETRDFPGLGTSGQGQLTISGGLANYPWDGRNVQELIELADNELMFKAKKAGKNTILLVGRDEQGKPSQPT